MTDQVDLINNLTTTKISLYNDMGFVELCDMMPRLVPSGRTADIAISKNARVSYAQGVKTLEEDTKLIRYLLENAHTSPFESVEFQFRIRAPIYVVRQLIRHRTANVNEQSCRYIVPKEEFYYPKLRMQSTSNKQGSSDATPSAEAEAIWELVQNNTAEMFANYTKLINLGVAKEVARTCLPISLMTEMMWKMDLHNLLHFLRLRMDSHAQQEIRDLAVGLYNLIIQVVPVSVKAFEDFRLEAVLFTKDDLECIKMKKEKKSLKPKLDRLMI